MRSCERFPDLLGVGGISPKPKRQAMEGFRHGADLLWITPTRKLVELPRGLDQNPLTIPVLV